jgi:hypothetical protein
MALTGLDTRISWRDFTERTSPPPEFEDHDAYTSAASLANLQPVRDHASGVFSFRNVVVTVAMSRRESWVIRGKQTDDLLRHEQNHYTITALGARDLHRRLLKMTALSLRDLEKAASDAQAEVQSLTDQANEDYDVASDHSKNATGQQLWNGAIRCVRADPDGELSDLVNNTAGVCTP